MNPNGVVYSRPLLRRDDKVYNLSNYGQIFFLNSLHYPKASKDITGLTEGPGRGGKRKAFAHRSEGCPEWTGLVPPGVGEP